MKEQEYREIEQYMLETMRDSAHDQFHIYRVLYAALDIAEGEEAVDRELLITACLLHDIGRGKQEADPRVDHAAAGGEMAYGYLTGRGWEPERAARVRDCIASHRYRKGREPRSLEGKILFDADKLDVAGAVGIARTLIYRGQTGEPLYLLNERGEALTEPTDADRTTFFQEYHYKLKQLYGRFYTARATELAAARREAAEHFYEALFREVSTLHGEGAGRLYNLLEP